MAYTAPLTRPRPNVTINPGRSELATASGGFRVEGAVVFATQAYPVANKALFQPFELPVAQVAKKIAWANSTTQNGNVDVGVYDHVGNLIVSLGGVAMGTVGIQIADIADTTLLPGYYFLAFVSSSSTGTFSRYAPSAMQLWSNGCQEMASAYPLPAVATFTNPTSAYWPVCWLTTVATA
jgi:hypothetical protein